MENILKNFITIKEVQEQRPGLTLYEDWQVQEALNMTLDLLDSECNGLILNVIQYSLGREAKDETHPLFRTTQELNYLKRAFVAQTQFIVNLKNDQTSGNNSLSTGGLSISSNRSNNFNQVAPGVYENLAKARVYKLNDAFKGENQDKKLLCLEKIFLTKEEASEYIKYYQPEAAPNSILVVNDSNLIRPMKTQDINWKTIKANEILDRDNVYRNIWNITNLAFFGKDGTSAMTRQEIYNAIWNSMFYNADVTYPNEAIVRVYNTTENLVYTFKSNQDNNKGHHPLFDNQDSFWWKEVGVADKINFDEVAQKVIDSKEFLTKINAINNEITKQMEALWEQIKDNEHLLKKFEELYDQTKTENDQLEQKLDTKIVANTNEINTLKTQYTNLNVNEIAYKNAENTFNQVQKFKGDAPHLDFYNISDTRIGYVGKGKKVSGDLYVTAETNSLLLQAKHNIDLTPGNGYAARYDKTPTMDVEIANKRYVDNAVANSGGNVDLSNVAKTNENNIFSGANNFTGETTLGGNVTIIRKIEYGFDEPIEGDLQLATKKYVDSVAGGVQAFYQTNVSWTITKKDVVSGIYAYIANNVRIQLPSNVVGWEANVFITIKHQNSPQSKTLFVPFTSFYRGSLQSDIVLGNITFLSGVDLNPGSAGNFNSNLTIEMTIIKVKRVY